ncbi:unnamed protein product [Prorocentrum cordatum]|uniref:Uncharacterized protein n=1 Tax=Prorocentrum cordatum TaxID=2364126 RepID=A0ABN9SPA4_9DINO|nr:unnamed protein product [Polarella glacialis]
MLLYTASRAVSGRAGSLPVDTPDLIVPGLAHASSWLLEEAPERFDVCRAQGKVAQSRCSEEYCYCSRSLYSSRLRQAPPPIRPSSLDGDCSRNAREEPQRVTLDAPRRHCGG